MRNPQSWLFFLTLSFCLTAAGGCKKSNPPPIEQAKPAPTATPSPAAHAAAPNAATPEDLLHVAASKTFQVVPPASFPVDQVPANEISEFLVAGHSNQMLRVEVAEEHKEGPLHARVAAQVASGQALTAADPDFCDDEKLYPLTQEGTVRIVYDPHGTSSSLRFSLMERSDPMLNVGLTPQQVSINYGSLGKDKGSEVRPYLHSCEVGSSWPAHVVRESDAGWLRIAQVEGYERVFPNDRSMQFLISSLKQQAKPLDAKKLPFADDDDAAIVLTARTELMKGEGWTGWRWIEGSTQDEDYPGGLGYTFEGVTDDGRFFLRMTGQISHPALKRLDPGDTQGPARAKAIRENRQLLEQALTKADPASFTPNLNEVDAMIQSIKIQR
ncbi:MAG TPA: hypothetical protein VKH81_17685 [Candidatus Angelobacter sp.]|nr:hypothetical protein [Candidatus Angelobacter sp.]